MFSFMLLSGFIFATTPIITAITNTIIIPLNIPYASPPTSLNCFSIGKFATKPNSVITTLNAIFTSMNNTIAVTAYIISLAIFSACCGNISFSTCSAT